MYKYLLVLMITFSISGCAKFTVNSSMCDNVGIGSQRSLEHITKECREYNKKDADKAFHKVVQEKKVSDKDIEFNKEENE